MKTERYFTIVALLLMINIFTMSENNNIVSGSLKPISSLQALPENYHFVNEWGSRGTGDDRLHGGPGNDTLRGGPGADYFRCDAGVDRIGAFNPLDGDREFGDCEIK